MNIVQVAVPAPFLQPLDYLFDAPTPPAPGTRVCVPLGRRQVVGIVCSHSNHSELATERLRTATLLDKDPALPEAHLKWLMWVARYYHHPIGEVLINALPVLLRHPQQELWGEVTWVQPVPRADQPRGAAQRRVLAQLGDTPAPLHAFSDIAADSRAVLRRLQAGGWITLTQQRPESYLPVRQQPIAPAVPATPEQAQAIATLNTCHGFSVTLLEGVTGAGKTEVYLDWIARHLDNGRQCLLLVPEISLTPQMLSRLNRRFQVPIAWQHSAANDTQRLAAWRASYSGEARLLVGTRSAVFTPLPELGAIVIDEEHDSSYKQQDKLRYHARSLAITRAREHDIPVLLGSATPSLESLENRTRGRYRGIHLRHRATGAAAPKLQLVDLRPVALQAGLAPRALHSLSETLEREEQVLVFINRRGYAPAQYCDQCAQAVQCPRCDAHLTVHHQRRILLCHHCHHQRPLDARCQRCGTTQTTLVGHGTERVEAELNALFPNYPVLRIDRDSTRKKGALEHKLAQIEKGEARLLVGTQMLAKGHDFPRLTLVIIVDADQSLYSPDFRASEVFAQTLVQVAGRAGRGALPGRVIIQTRSPDHPLWQALLRGGYPELAKVCLAERREFAFPPYRRMAIIRAESQQEADALALLDNLASDLGPQDQTQVELLGPAAAAMPRRAGYYRAQLLLLCAHAPLLHRLLSQSEHYLSRSKEARKLRWSIDVDPIDSA